MARLKTYNSKQVTIVFGGVILSGYAEGDFCSVEMNEDAFTHHVGADGEECRAKSNNNSGKITVKLAQYSESNRRLAELHEADKASNAGVAPMLVTDRSGASLHASDEAYIAKAPAAAYSKAPGDREWVFNCSNMKHFVGGN
jgi:hypothetical protein